MERLTDDKFLKNGFYQPKSKDEEKEIRSMGNDLTFEKLYKHCAEVEKQNAELQKQVDVLTNENERLSDLEFTQEHCDLYKENEYLKSCLTLSKKQAVKDTAKEILGMADKINKGGQNDLCELEVAIKERYGVEVE